MDKNMSLAVFARRGWLSGQPGAFRETVIGMGRLVELDRGEPIFREGDAAGGVFGIASGSMAVHGGTKLQASVLANILRSGDWFGQTPVLVGGERTLGFVAAEPTVLLQVPLTRLRPMLQADPDFAMRIGQLADFAARTTIQVARDLLTPDSSRRLAAVLLRVTAMGEVPPTDASGYVLTQRELGEMANLSRSQVNAALGRFQASGWIELGYNRVRLVDVEALKGFAYAD